MIVNSVSLNENKARTFGNLDRRELFANLSDDDIRKIAYKKAAHDTNDKKHRTIDSLLYANVPVAAGIAAAVAKPASRIGRLANFGKGFASWAVPFVVIDSILGAKHLTQKVAPGLKEFDEKHPVTSAFVTFGVAIAAYAGLMHGGTKLLSKYGSKITEKAAPYVEKLANKLEGSKVLDKLATYTKKIPSAAADIGKKVLNWTPWALIFANIFHSINHEKIKTREFVNNYETIKAAQDQVRRDLAEKAE